jgi:hypothetical protein
MKHFKLKNGEIFAFEGDGSQDDLIPDGAVELTADELGAIINPPLSAEEEVAQQRKEAMLTGVEFDGVMCSALKEDQWGLNSVKDFVVAGNSIPFEFMNGNTLLLTPDNIAGFEAVWIPFRASFFSL